MKTNRNTIASITTAAIAMIAGTAASQAASRTLLLLQENSSGTSYMTDILPAGPIRAAADAIIDTFVENGEAAKFQALAAGKYQRFVNLSDANCTRARLLAELIKQSKDGFTVDLAVLGHGGPEALGLHNGGQLTGQTFQTLVLPTGQRLQIPVPGSIRTLLTDARNQEGANFTFKLRLVHMCNCFGGTTNDDWLAIGAKVSVGAPLINWMPEPMITFFWDDFVKNDKHVAKAAADSLAATRPIWSLVPGYASIQTAGPGTVGMTKLAETQQTVAGNGDLIFKDEFQLALNESRTFTVKANQTHNFPQVYLVAGQTYSFTSSSTDMWSNGIIPPFITTTNANGYTAGPADGLRRFPTNMMRLVAERFARSGDVLSFISNSGFSVGTSSTGVTPGIRGFLCMYANDVITAYGDNSGQISVTIRRTN